MAVLVFPGILKAGLGVGGQYGEGVLFKGGKAVGYYNTAGASVGLQAGGQKYGYALFFLNNETLKALDQANGFEIGVGPSVVVADEGMGKYDDHDDRLRTRSTRSFLTRRAQWQRLASKVTKSRSIREVRL